MYKFKKENTIGEVIKELEYRTGLDRIYFDDSRAWCLYTQNHNYANLNKFGAYRDYLGGGIRGCLKHNGRTQSRNLTKGKLFYNALLRIEELYNSECIDLETWEQATGVLL